jgi:hypothetical protein
LRLKIGSNRFENVTIPVLWGKRAIIQDDAGRISIIDLSGPKARPEIIGDEVAPGVRYGLKDNGFTVMSDGGEELYTFSPEGGLLVSGSLELPELQVEKNRIRVGSSTFQSNMVSGSQVGIIVDRNGIGLGAPLPPGLAPLVV